MSSSMSLGRSRDEDSETSISRDIERERATKRQEAPGNLNKQVAAVATEIRALQAGQRQLRETLLMQLQGLSAELATGMGQLRQELANLHATPEAVPGKDSFDSAVSATAGTSAPRVERLSKIERPPQQQASILRFRESVESLQSSVASSSAGEASCLQAGGERPSISNTFIAATLPNGWPSTLDKKEAFAHIRSNPSSIKRLHTAQSGSKSFLRHPTLEFGQHDKMSEARYRVVAVGASMVTLPAQRVASMVPTVLSPDSSTRLLMDFCSSVLLIYELAATPYELSWRIPVLLQHRVVVWIAAIWWTFDVLMNFSTGFYEDGELKMSRAAIAHKYGRTWFVPDILILLCDWLVVFASANMAETARLVKMFRVFRLARLGESVDMRIFNEANRMGHRVLCGLVFILFFNHAMSCLWNGLPRLVSTDTGARWQEVLISVGSEEHQYVDLGPMYQYFTVFHWYVSQMTVGNEMIYCFNSAERIFNITGILLGLLVNCTLVSAFSAAMLDIVMSKRDKKSEMRRLHQFLIENHVGPHLSVLVQKQVVQRLRKADRLREADVKALDLLSPSLFSELRFEIFAPFLTRHPLFRLWASLDLGSTQHLCSSAECVEFIYVVAQDDLFLAGELCQEAYYLVGGLLSYTQDPETSPVVDVVKTHVPEGSWLCEAALWTEWIHVGHAQAMKKCQLLRLSVDGIVKTMSKHRMIAEITNAYCQAYYKRVTRAMPPEASWPSDLSVPYTDYGELVEAMAPEAKTTISFDAIEQVEASTRMPWFQGRTVSVGRMREQVTNALCNFVVTGAGECERVLASVDLLLEREDTSIFTILGTTAGTFSAKTPCCGLPSGYQEGEELPGDVMRRVLESMFGPLGDSAALEHVERQVFIRESSRGNGPRTKLLRTLCSLRFEVDLEDIVGCCPEAEGRPAVLATLGSMSSMEPLAVPEAVAPVLQCRWEKPRDGSTEEVHFHSGSPTRSSRGSDNGNSSIPGHNFRGSLRSAAPLPEGSWAVEPTRRRDIRASMHSKQSARSATSVERASTSRFSRRSSYMSLARRFSLNGGKSMRGTHADVRASLVSAGDLKQSFPRRQVYFFSGGADGQGAFGTWLLPEEFDFLVSPAGEAVVHYWIRGLIPDDPARQVSAGDGAFPMTPPRASASSEDTMTTLGSV